jgi:hypothetical protein
MSTDHKRKFYFFPRQHLKRYGFLHTYILPIFLNESSYIGEISGTEQVAETKIHIKLAYFGINLHF